MNSIDKQHLAEATDWFERTPGTMKSDAIVAHIRQALSKVKIININYTKLSGAASLRITEPYEMKIGEYGVYLYAYDITPGKKQSIKKFLVDRITNVLISKRGFRARWPVKI